MSTSDAPELAVEAYDAELHQGLRRLISEHADYERLPAPPQDVVNRLVAATSAGRIQCWVANDRGVGRLVGYATMTTDYSTIGAVMFGHLDCLFVDAEYRSAGIGATLFNVVVDSCASQGLTDLQWQTPDWNQRASRFYERRGGIPRAKMRFSLPITRPGAELSH